MPALQALPIAVGADSIVARGVDTVFMKLLVFGFGYTSHHVAERLRPAGVQISATVRSQAKADMLTRSGIRAKVFSPEQCDPAIAGDVAAAEAILVSVPPDARGSRARGVRR